MPALSFLRADFSPPQAQDALTPAPATSDVALTGLAGYIRSCFDGARDNRRNQGVDDRMLAALRALRGEYDAETLNAIRAFGGSEIYARITASKVRSTAALLREIYTSTDRPWSLSPTPEPLLSGPTLDETVQSVLVAETQEMLAMGMVPNPEAVKARVSQLRDEVQQLRKKAAEEALRRREMVIDDLLWEGGFYEALWQFLGDIPLFPFAVLKGPVVRYRNAVVWNGNTPVAKRTPMPHWERCSPFDVFFAPWSQNPQDGFIIHRERINRGALQSMRGLKNYDTAAIDRLLDNWGRHNCAWYDYNESERAELEQRESDIAPLHAPNGNERPMPMLSFYGTVSRKMLEDWGMPKAQLPSGEEDPSIFAYLVGNEVIGVTLNPHPTGRLPFYCDSFERVAGSCYGNGIHDMIEDIQGVGNAALRALVNNLSIASGPMGWLNEDRIASNDPNALKLWPWKMFSFSDPMSSTGSSEKPMEFFQPDNNVQELLTVYERFVAMADEISTIPRYMQGSGASLGGAGRTAAGLSMLMESSNRTIKQTVSSIDHNVIESAVEDLNVYLALTRPDIVMEGDISVLARGAVELMQKETLRMRRLEFMNITNNPIDQQLVGVEGRYHLLRELARDLGMPLSDTIPIDQATIKQIQQANLAMAMGQMQGAQTGAAPPQGGPAPGGSPEGAPPPAPTEGVARQQSNNPGA